MKRMYIDMSSIFDHIPYQENFDLMKSVLIDCGCKNIRTAKFRGWNSNQPKVITFNMENTTNLSINKLRLELADALGTKWPPFISEKFWR